MNVLESGKTYFEEHGEELLAAAGLSKVQFAQAMGIKAQNVGKMIATKNALSLAKVAEVLDIPLQVLVYGPEQNVVDVRGCVYVNGAPYLVSKKRDIEELLEILA